jgi:hypothetical protein
MSLGDVLDGLYFELQQGPLAPYIINWKAASAQTLRNSTNCFLNEELLHGIEGTCLVIVLNKGPRHIENFATIEFNDRYQNYPIVYQIPGTKVLTGTQ